MPFDPGKELDKLESKITHSHQEDVREWETFQVRAAIRAKGWDQLFIEDAIGRGFRRRAGEEVGPAPWRDLAEQQADEEAAKLTVKANRSESEAFLEGGRSALQRASEVSRRQTAEEDEELSGGVPPVRINLLDKESQEQEEVREEEPEEPPYAGVGLSKESQLAALEKEKPVDDFWDCPNCTSVNKLEEDICPMCNLDRSWIEMKVFELVNSVNTGLFTKEEHVRFLNDVTIIRRKNPRWIKFLIEYMKKSSLKPTDMEGLIGPRPWMDDPLYYRPDEEEIEEKKMTAETLTLQGGGKLEGESLSDKELLGSVLTKHYEEKEKKLGSVKEHIKETLEASSTTECPKCDTGMIIAGEPTGSWACPECGWNIGYPEGESPSLKFLQDNKPQEEQRDPIPAPDRRMKVIVSEEAGWLCLDCNRVWPYDFDDCATCKLGRKAEELPEGDVPAHVHGDSVDDCELCKAEAAVDDLYKDVKEQEDMDFSEKVKLMLQLKAKEKEDAPVA